MSETRHLGGARRILVYGVTGSGKSTLAREIADATGIAWTDVDEHTWRPGWTPVPDEEQLRYFTDVCAREAWILDTAYHRWRHVALERAEVIVALDYTRWVSLRRLLWHFRSLANRRTQIAEWAASSSGPPVVRLRSPGETSAWLAALRAGSEPAH